MILYLDLETYSPVPIARGVHAYAGQVEILLTAWALDDGPVQVDEGWSDGAAVAVDMADEIVIHNSHFDRTVLRHAERVVLPLDRLHDTLAQARSHGLPGALGRLCEIFSIPADEAKDKAGKQLIQLFCKPRPKTSKIARATAETHPVEWERFREYAGADILAMRALRRIMPTWNYALGTPEHRLWQLDQRINDRGFLTDRRLAEGAVAAIEAEQARMAGRVVEITHGEVEAATQRDRLLAHLLGTYGVHLPDMRGDTLERRLHDETLPDPVRELIALRLDTSTTSTAKYRKLLDAVSPDNRLRGALEYCGAARTGRWAGRLFQPQNLFRPTMPREDIEMWTQGFIDGSVMYV